MMMDLYKKYKEVILYIFFGCCTTLVNVGTYYIWTRWFHIHLLVSTVAAWFFAVLFAYITNRKYVFMSKNTNSKAIMLEFTSFIFCRLFTGALDLGNMYIFVHLLKFNDFFIKVASNLFVIIGNYIASRLFIFKKHFKQNELDNTTPITSQDDTVE